MDCPRRDAGHIAFTGYDWRREGRRNAFLPPSRRPPVDVNGSDFFDAEFSVGALLLDAKGSRQFGGHAGLAEM